MLEVLSTPNMVQSEAVTVLKVCLLHVIFICTVNMSVSSACGNARMPCNLAVVELTIKKFVDTSTACGISCEMKNVCSSTHRAQYGISACIRAGLTLFATPSNRGNVGSML